MADNALAGEPALYGMLAEFDTPDALAEAARLARAQGYRRLDAFSPFPVEGVQEALGLRDRRLGYVAFLGAVAGLAATMAVAWYVTIDYPINVGGRPLFAVPAFAVIGFEVMILATVAFAIGGMLVLNRLPRLNHPVFGGQRFGLASDDRFFLCVLADDPNFAEGATREFLGSLSPRTIETVRA